MEILHALHEALPGIMFLVLFAVLLFGYPVAFTLGGVGLYFGLSTFGPDFFKLLPLRYWGRMTNFTLMAVPLFIYMGVMLEKSGIAEELLETMGLLFGRLRGGLAISVVVVGALLAASTGIVGASVVTMGLLSLPTMLRRKYTPEMATGVISASGTLGQIIPPSIVLVILGTIMEIPIGDIFLGAVLPGFLLVFFYILWILVIAVIKPEEVPPMPEEELREFKGKKAVARVFKVLVPPFFLIVAVLGSIFAGIASPTEAAGVGALGATILTICYRKFSYQTLKAVMRSTTFLTTMVFIILLGATTFGLVFRGMNGDTFIRGIIKSLPFSKWGILIIVMGIIFIAGFFLDFIEISFIHIPVLAPIMINDYHVDPLWLAVLLALNLQTSFLTPPFGFSLFYLKGVAPPEVTTKHIYKGIIPYVIIQILTIVVVGFFPMIVKYLPEVVFRK